MSSVRSPRLPFGNPFRFKTTKGSKMHPKLISLLNAFEHKLNGRIRKLKSSKMEDSLHLSWLCFAVNTLCEVHSDVINLITALELPVSDWDDNWIEVYLENSVKLLDICNTFTSEISRIKQGHLFLKSALRNLNDDSFEKQFHACSSLEKWKQQISKKNPKLDDCFYIIDGLVRMLDLPKVKNSDKGKILMRAMYGVKVLTISICSVFAAAFSESPKRIMNLQVSETYLWSGSFTDLQTFLKCNQRGVIKELEDVDISIEKINRIVKDESKSMKGEMVISELSESSEKLSQGLYKLSEEVDRFFGVVLTGRDTLLTCNVRVGDGLSNKTGKPQVF